MSIPRCIATTKRLLERGTEGARWWTYTCERHRGHYGPHAANKGRIFDHSGYQTYHEEINFVLNWEPFRSVDQIAEDLDRILECSKPS